MFGYPDALISGSAGRPAFVIASLYAFWSQSQLSFCSYEGTNCVSCSKRGTARH